MDDALGRKWQMGTIQLDSQMPSRFGLKYVGPDNHEHDLYVVHRALYGSFERFLGIVIEHYGGGFPFWLSPVQIRFVPVSDDFAPAAEAMAERIREAGYRVEVDSSDETVGKRIRNSQVDKIPFTVVFGERESEESLAVRERGGEQSNPSLTEFLESLAKLSA
jgi:threonyl-tRNA synthetase